MVQIAPDVFHIPLMFRNSINCFIIDGVLIDSGTKHSLKKILKCIEKVSVHAHALTHAHPDHQGSTFDICSELNIPMYCHAGELETLGPNALTKTYAPPIKSLAWLMNKLWCGKSSKPTKLLCENDKIESFTVVETPGHSLGHISFFREKDGILIIGDAVNNMNLFTTIEGLRLPLSMLNEDEEMLKASVKKLAQLHPKIIGFGHGPVLYNTEKQFEKFAATI